MSNILAGIRTYVPGWSVKRVEKFSNEELGMIRCAKVVSSAYGLSCRLDLISGNIGFIPLSNDSDMCVGDEISPKDVTIVILEKPGCTDIQRMVAKKADMQ